MSEDLLCADGLAPGASRTLRVMGSQGKPERVWIVSTVTMDGRGEGLRVEIAVTLATWLGESIQIQNISELVKLLTIEDSSQAIDGVIERLTALDTQPPVTIDARITTLVADTALSRNAGSVEFAFYTGLNRAKQYAIRQVTGMKDLTGEARRKFAERLLASYAKNTDRLNLALQGLGR
jgi:hypothetical protein